MWKLFKNKDDEIIKGEIIKRLDKLAQDTKTQFESLNVHIKNQIENQIENQIRDQISDQIENRIIKVIEKIESKQKETMLQLEDIDSLLQEELENRDNNNNGNGNDNNGLPKALMALIETIYDFYLYVEPGTPLFDQAEMMFGRSVKTAKDVELEVIVDEGANFDFRLHTAHGTEEEPNLPDGHIVKTLQCGFIYKDEILRRAVVIVNKLTDM